MSMAEFDRGVVFKEQEVIVKHVLCTDGTINAMLVGELVRCKDCKHRPTGEDRDNLEFPDERCPCQCEDGWYNWKPADDWYCGNGEPKEGEIE